MVGFQSFCISWMENQIVGWRVAEVQRILARQLEKFSAVPELPGYFYWMASSIFFVVIACFLTVFVAPAAMGSGVAEVMGLLNGIHIDKAIGIYTLIVKIFGTLFGICAGLCIGKEGPLVHIGAIIGVCAIYLPFDYNKVLQNDVHRRYMIAAGAACGISCAFGAPIGGALFVYEISMPNTFWNFQMLWRVFLATCTAVFTFSILYSMSIGAPLSMSDGAALKFGDVTQIGQNSILDLPAAIVLGTVGGVLGALFVQFTVWNAVWRKKYINTDLRKVLECVAVAVITASAFYGVVYFRRGQCRPVDYSTNFEYVVQWTCPTG